MVMVGIPQARRTLKGTGIDERIILKCIVMK
jgi:hypothetical protein